MTAQDRATAGLPALRDAFYLNACRPRQIAVDARDALDLAFGGEAFVEAFHPEGFLLLAPYGETFLQRLARLSTGSASARARSRTL